MSRWLLPAVMFGCAESGKEPLTEEPVRDEPDPVEPTEPTELTEPTESTEEETLPDLDATGSWSGDCAGDDGYGNEVPFYVWLELEDDEGGITGSGTTEGGGCVIDWPVWGWRTDDQVVLDLERPYTWPVLLELTLAGDTMSGTLTTSPYETTTGSTYTFPCTLVR